MFDVNRGLNDHGLLRNLAPFKALAIGCLLSSSAFAYDYAIVSGSIQAPATDVMYEGNSYKFTLAVTNSLPFRVNSRLVGSLANFEYVSLEAPFTRYPANGTITDLPLVAVNDQETMTLYCALPSGVPSGQYRIEVTVRAYTNGTISSNPEVDEAPANNTMIVVMPNVRKAPTLPYLGFYNQTAQNTNNGLPPRGRQPSLTRTVPAGRNEVDANETLTIQTHIDNVGGLLDIPAFHLDYYLVPSVVHAANS